MKPTLVNKDKIYTFINKHPVLVNEIKIILDQIPNYFPEAINIIVRFKEYVHICVIIPSDVVLFNEKKHLFYTDYLAASYIKTNSLFRVLFFTKEYEEKILKDTDE